MTAISTKTPTKVNAPVVALEEADFIVRNDSNPVGGANQVCRGWVRQGALSRDALTKLLYRDVTPAA